MQTLMIHSITVKGRDPSLFLFNISTFSRTFRYFFVVLCRTHVNTRLLHKEIYISMEISNFISFVDIMWDLLQPFPTERWWIWTYIHYILLLQKELLISLCGSFVERHSFRIVSGELPEKEKEKKSLVCVSACFLTAIRKVLSFWRETRH